MELSGVEWSGGMRWDGMGAMGKDVVYKKALCFAVFFLFVALLLVSVMG